MHAYANTLKIKDALQIYFSYYHFKDGGYNLKWFKIKLGRFFIPLPNIKSRVDAVKIHDIHHLVTGYEADYRGEAEIAGWEIASGCEKYSAAWLLNFGSFFYGMFLYPRYLFRAFMRGRKCKTNLYYNTAYNEILLNKTIGDLKKEIEPDTPKKNSLKDYIAFTKYCIICLCYYAAIFFIFFFALYKLFIYLF